MRILCSGDTRAYTEMWASLLVQLRVGHAHPAPAPETARSPFAEDADAACAMAVAVTLWSPVIMMVRMPPRLRIGDRLLPTRAGAGRSSRPGR